MFENGVHIADALGEFHNIGNYVRDDAEICHAFPEAAPTNSFYRPQRFTKALFLLTLLLFRHWVEGR